MQIQLPDAGCRDRAGADHRRRAQAGAGTGPALATSSRRSTTSSATSPGRTATGCTSSSPRKSRPKVAADKAYQNAKKNSDKQNARIEHDKALARVMIGLLKDDTELFKQFSDNPSFKTLADATRCSR